MITIEGKIFYRAGDIVRLRCGGPAMAVCWANGEGTEIQTVWHDTNRVMQMIRIPVDVVIPMIDGAMPEPWQGPKAEVVPRGTDGLDQLKARTAEALLRKNGDLE